MTVAIFLVAFLVRVVFLYGFSDYCSYLFSDMGGYWQRALVAYSGDHSSFGQWAIWPIFYHELIAMFMHVLAFAGINAGLWLQCWLLFQSVVTSSSMIAVFKIAQKRLGNIPAFLFALLGSVCYALVYLNAFVLSECIGVPLLVWALWSLLSSDCSRFNLCMASLLLSLAVLLRPGYSLFMFPVMWYVWRSYGLVRMFSNVCVVFLLVLSAGAFSVCGFSHRVILGLSPNAGMNFAIAQADILDLTQRFEYRGGTYAYRIVAPGLLDEGGRKLFVDQPAFNQRYYYRLGFAALSGRTVVRDIEELRKLWIGILLPTELLPGFRIADFVTIVQIAAATGLLLLSPLLYFVRPQRMQLSTETWLFWGLLMSLLVTCFIFGSERRYMYALQPLWTLGGMFVFSDVLICAKSIQLPISNLTERGLACQGQRVRYERPLTGKSTEVQSTGQEGCLEFHGS